MCSAMSFMKGGRTPLSPRSHLSKCQATTRFRHKIGGCCRHGSQRSSRTHLTHSHNSEAKKVSCVGCNANAACFACRLYFSKRRIDFLENTMTFRPLLTALVLLLPAGTPAQISAEAETAAAIARIEKLNPQIHAVIAVDPDALAQARALDRIRTARGPLFGLPILIKGNIESKGSMPTTAGSLALKNNVTGRDAPLVERLRAAGAVIVGKTNLSEWANIRSSTSISGWSAVGGQTRNPFALDRNPCGSSSGSGAAVAAGMVEAAIGTETDG